MEAHEGLALRGEDGEVLAARGYPILQPHGTNASREFRGGPVGGHAAEPCAANECLGHQQTIPAPMPGAGIGGLEGVPVPRRAGRSAKGKANGAWRHGQYSNEAREVRRECAVLLRQLATLGSYRGIANRGASTWLEAPLSSSDFDAVTQMGFAPASINATSPTSCTAATPIWATSAIAAPWFRSLPILAFLWARFYGC
jgi:hypothetical protein